MPKHTLILTDRKSPAMEQPLLTPAFAGKRWVPLSLSENVETVQPVPGATLAQGTLLYTDAAGLATVSPVGGVLEGYTACQHPLYGDLVCAVIRSDTSVAPVPLALNCSPDTATAQQILLAAQRAGIIDELDGMPLYVKLTEAKGLHVVADATEPEPFSSAAYTVLCKQQEAVVGGLQLAATAAAATDATVAVCAVTAAMKKTLSALYAENIVYFTDRYYPVTRYTQREDAEVCRIGVQALAALYTAVTEKLPPAACIVTVAGDAVRAPHNVLVPFGTPIAAVLDACGLDQPPAVVVAGDAITGVEVPDTSVPVLPGITCLLALRQVPLYDNDPCIGCGQCAGVCHAGLLPYEIARQVENIHYEKLPPLHPEDCDGCGACTYICPARRDVMQQVLYAAESGGRVFLDWGGNEDG